jgi:hypothetical protein
LNYQLEIRALPQVSEPLLAVIGADIDARTPKRKHSTDSQKSAKRDRTPGFDLLPMARREPERDHVFLTVAMLLTQFANPIA